VDDRLRVEDRPSRRAESFSARLPPSLCPCPSLCPSRADRAEGCPSLLPLPPLPPLPPSLCPSLAEAGACLCRCSDAMGRGAMPAGGTLHACGLHVHAPMYVCSAGEVLQQADAEVVGQPERQAPEMPHHACACEACARSCEVGVVRAVGVFRGAGLGLRLGLGLGLGLRLRLGLGLGLGVFRDAGSWPWAMLRCGGLRWLCCSWLCCS